MLVAVALILSYGCGQGADTVVVDFSKTIPAEKPGSMPQDAVPLKVAVGAMVSPKETFIYYRQLLDYIGERLDRKVEFVQRKTYGEVNELLGEGQIDLAFICSGPYALGKGRYGFELVATPQIQGSPFYRSYLIVNKQAPFQRLEDLKGRVFAFTDPDSNTGRLVPAYWLAEKGKRAEIFFGKTIYTHGHDNSILAAAKNLVDGAAVDSLIWEYYDQKDPAFTSQTRIIRKSEPYGIPPVVASRSLDPNLREKIRQLLLSMHLDPAGKRILEAVGIDRFVGGEEEWYEPIRRMERAIASLKEKVDGTEKP
ncbi:MAG: phosphate/phosphite/phosphonate ABC transporter substrate-binding protein [Pseudomonadota bacterium]